MGAAPADLGFKSQFGEEAPAQRSLQKPSNTRGSHMYFIASECPIFRALVLGLVVAAGKIVFVADLVVVLLQRGDGAGMGVEGPIL